jgi:outer membrane receptor protein involved in Fe transport
MPLPGGLQGGTRVSKSVSVHAPWWALAAAVTVMSAVVPLAAAAAPADEDAFSLVQEEQQVLGAAKRAQPLSETPSAVSVITSSEIRAMGYRSLGEALQWVRGMFVTNDRNYSYLGIRGLLRPGDYNVRVLLTIDGHAMNGAVFGDAPFGEELGLDMELVERIEVVRGPGSALYGSSAVLAVVNVVTRRPQQDEGLALGGRRGSDGDWRGFVSGATARPGRPAATFHASWTRTRGGDVYFAEFDHPATNFGRAIDADGEESVNLFGTVEWGGLRLAAKWNERMKRFPTAAFGTRFNDRDSRTIDGHNFVELSAEPRLASDLTLAARAYWDGTPYDGFYAFDGDSGRDIGVDDFASDLAGVETRVHWSPWSRHVLTAGIEQKVLLRARQYYYTESPHTVWVNIRESADDSHTGIFAQTESRLGEKIRVTVGARFDQSTESGSAWSPRADVIWQAAQKTTLKFLAGSAFRAPTEFEREYETSAYRPNAALQPERAMTLEVGADHRIGSFSLRGDLYRTTVKDLIDLVAPDESSLQYQNLGAVRLFGGGVEAEYADPTGRRARWSLALQRSEDTGNGSELTSSPRFNSQLVLIEPHVFEHVTAAVGMRYLSPARTLGGARTASALLADGRLGWKPRPGIEIGLEGRNLFDGRHTAVASTEFSLDEIAQAGRSATLTVTLLR